MKLTKACLRIGGIRVHGENAYRRPSLKLETILPNWPFKDSILFPEQYLFMPSVWEEMVSDVHTIVTDVQHCVFFPILLIIKNFYWAVLEYIGI